MRSFFPALLLLIGTTIGGLADPCAESRETLLLDAGWRFHLGDAAAPARG